MACNLNTAAYEKLLEENKQWLLANSPDSLEREHIIAVMEASAREYRNRGYDEAMRRDAKERVGA